MTQCPHPQTYEWKPAGGRLHERCVVCGFWLSWLEMQAERIKLLPFVQDGGNFLHWNDDDLLPWKPSIFMPRWASRITLEITDIRVERLQDISEEDAIAEGISKDEWFGLITVRRDFQKLWDSINGKKHPWESNPYVWVVSFRELEVA